MCQRDLTVRVEPPELEVAVIHSIDSTWRGVLLVVEPGLEGGPLVLQIFERENAP